MRRTTSLRKFAVRLLLVECEYYLLDIILIDIKTMFWDVMPCSLVNG
jgi:hypothetical protein